MGKAQVGLAWVGLGVLIHFLGAGKGSFGGDEVDAKAVCYTKT